MTTDLYVVSECCPVGCGIEVVLLRARPSGRLIAYRELCGCVWSDPASAQFEHGLGQLTPPWALAPGGVDLPGSGDVQAARFGESVLRTMPVSKDWAKNLEALNAKIAQNIAT